MMIQTSWRLSELVCVYFLPIGRGVFLSTLWRLSSFPYSYLLYLTPWVVSIIKISHCNFLKVDLMGVWNHRILTTKLLWLYESGSDVCFCEIIGTLKTGHFENSNSPTFCSSALSLIWSRVRKFSSEDVSGVFAFEVKFRLQTGSITSRSNSNYYCNAPWFWEHTLT